MQLGWIDFSKEDRQKAFDVINLLSEQGAVDELGIGVIRDAFANYFFPGTSTIQTRAKYFLIVPYMLREAVDGRYGKDANRVLRAIDSAEKDCGIRLLEADPKAEGVIGSRVLPKGWVARKPSDIVQPLKKQNHHIHSNQYDFSTHIPKETLSLTSESAYPDRMLPPASALL